MKVAIYFAVYKRLKVLKIFLDGLERLKEENKDIEFIPFAVYSNDDEGIILKEYGVRSLKFDNEYLGRKKNAGLKEVLKLDWDYLLELGSDDLVSSKLIDFYRPRWEAGDSCFGISSCYFIDSATGRVAFWKHNYAIGAGRCIKRSVLDTLGHRRKVRYLECAVGENECNGAGAEVIYVSHIADRLIKNGLCEFIEDVNEPFGLWSDKRQIALDSDSQFILGINGYHVKALDVGDEVMIIDIKGDGNLHPFEKFEVCDKENVLDGFSDKEIDGIRQIR